MTYRRFLSLGVLLTVLTCALVLPAGAREADDPLFNGKDLTGWKTFITPADKSGAKAEDVWSVKDGVLICKGKPFGYIITEKEYANYMLELEWKWPGKAGNSGVLLHTSGPDKIWPKAAEAQLMANNAGDIWLIDFKLDVDPARQDPKNKRHYYRMKTDKPVENPVGEWNKYRITCKQGTITLEINGQLVNSGKHAELQRGKILLQAEGAEIHFRNIKLSPVR